jgi:hypothetical protein
MNGYRATSESEAPQWTPQTIGVRALALQGVVTLRAGDESNTAEGEIVVIERDPRSKPEDVPLPTNGRLRTAVALNDIRTDVIVDFRSEDGLQSRSVPFFSGFTTTGWTTRTGPRLTV